MRLKIYINQASRESLEGPHNKGERIGAENDRGKRGGGGRKKERMEET